MSDISHEVVVHYRCESCGRVSYQTTDADFDISNPYQVRRGILALMSGKRLCACDKNRGVYGNMLARKAELRPKKR